MRRTLLLAHVTVNKLFLKLLLPGVATCLVILTVFNSLNRIDTKNKFQ